MTEEIILGVTIFDGIEVHSLPEPNRHHDILHDYYEQKGYALYARDFGFYTNLRMHIDRHEAFVLALENEQYARELKYDDKGNCLSYNGDELYSEDLW